MQIITTANSVYFQLKLVTVKRLYLSNKKRKSDFKIQHDNTLIILVMAHNLWEFVRLKFPKSIGPAKNKYGDINRSYKTHWKVFLLFWEQDFYLHIKQPKEIKHQSSHEQQHASMPSSQNFENNGIRSIIAIESN